MMVQAFSQLKRVLGERGMSVPELRRRLEAQGLSVHSKTLYRLIKDDEPLERLNLRVAGMICQVCDVPLSRLIAFEKAAPRIRRLSLAKQQRLDKLMDGNNEGRLTPAQHRELRGLVREAEEIALSNARKLAGQHRTLSAMHGSEKTS
ncbi:MAG TPA: helix-turn-helix transcriptional regulator [Isosphaeraceae bacterium]|nr:helix-turn-helix transcriptional regulator [Isosphaeraceae bacterium]